MSVDITRTYPQDRKLVTPMGCRVAGRRGGARVRAGPSNRPARHPVSDRTSYKRCWEVGARNDEDGWAGEWRKEEGGRRKRGKML
eukprot:758142-Hanusia_phi.AAC.1